MAHRLIDVTPDLTREWFTTQSKRSPVQAVRALTMLAGLLRWCATRREWRSMVNRDAARAAELADLLPPKVRRTDSIELAQLKPWFAGTDKLRSRMARAYLQALLLTGARREEMAALKWADVDFQWKKLSLADKVGERRVIPLTPYMAALIGALPRETLSDGTPNPYVFASNGKTGHIAEPRSPHEDVLADAAIPHVSIHALRRTFALTGEAAGAPAGAIAQVMGHRPSAVAEGYKPRSIDALRPYLAKVERFILDLAGVEFDEAALTAGGLRLVAASA
jgi:integrase